MAIKAVVVFTGEPKERIAAEAGTRDWYVKPATVNQCEYVVCIRNAHPPGAADLKPGPEPHGTGFLVGRISGTVATRIFGETQRHKIAISEYAEIGIHRLRDKMRSQSQNPVNYSTLEELGIELADLKFRPVSSHAEPPASPPVRRTEAAVTSLAQVVSDAKKALAEKLGVDPEQIEISVRWRSAVVPA